MAKKFSIETHHAFVFMPKYLDRPMLTAGTFVVNNLYTRDKQDLPTRASESHTPVKILAMEKIILIQ
jgi:hypothetical protein